MDLELGRSDVIWVSIAHSISGIFRQSASTICLLLIASTMWPGYLVSVGRQPLLLIPSTRPPISRHHLPHPPQKPHKASPKQLLLH